MLFGMLGDWLSNAIADEQIRSLVVDGVVGGVGSVMSFVPLIVILYFFISLLEDTGYMARAAFLIDRVMRAMGLHGKSFIPMILGFGCTVPGIMAARTLDNEKDRLVTIFAAPFMSCGARLPVYTLLIAAFFGASGNGGTVLFGIYLLGIIVAILVAVVLRHTIFKGEKEPFVMELPPYHIPTVKDVLMHMWERSVLYLKKAGTFILGASIIVWFLTAYPMDVEYSRDFEAARTNVEEQMTAQQTTVLQGYGMSSLEDNAALNGMYASMLAAAEAPAEEDAEESAYPAGFAALEAQNPEVYAQALPLYDLKVAADDQIALLDEQEASEKISQSYAASIGHFIEPVIAPLGFDWKIGVGIVACSAAKEVMVSTLATIYSVQADEEDQGNLVTYLQEDPSFNPAVGLALMVFTLLYMPCVAAMAVIKRETNSWKMLFLLNGMCVVLAYVLAFVTYHGALLLGLGA